MKNKVLYLLFTIFTLFNFIIFNHSLLAEEDNENEYSYQLSKDIVQIEDQNNNNNNGIYTELSKKKLPLSKEDMFGKNNKKLIDIGNNNHNIGYKILNTLTNAFSVFKLNNTNGLYVFGGGLMSFNNTSTDTMQYGVLNSLPSHPSQKQFSYYFSIGARILYSNIFLAGEFFYLNPSFTDTTKYNFNAETVIYVGSATNAQTKNFFNTNYQIQRIYGFNLRGGFGVNRMVFYGKIGFGIVNGTLTTTGDSRNQTLVLQKFSETTKQQNYALHYGAGMEFFVTESFFLRAEYNEFNFSTKTLMNGISFNGDQVVYQSNHVLRNVVFGVGFKFF